MVKHLVLFVIGGTSYYCVELLYRGFSAWQMLIIGGICFILIGQINELFPWFLPLWTQSVMAAAGVTIVELLSGYVLNIRLNLNIWDYSNMPLNLAGQICLSYSLLWVVLGTIAIIIDDWLRYLLFHEEKPKYKLI